MAMCSTISTRSARRCEPPPAEKRVPAGRDNRPHGRVPSRDWAPLMDGGDDFGRLTRVHAWVAEHAGRLQLPVAERALCETAVDRLRMNGAGITVGDGSGWPETRYSTDTLSKRLAELQITVGEGPSVIVLRTGAPVLAADLDSVLSQHRWPLFAPLAVEAGARALFALPLRVGTKRVGVLALHRVDAGWLDMETLANSVEFAELAFLLLLDEQARSSMVDSELAAERWPLDSPQVHQATGMIAVQAAIGLEDAFARLRARAFADRRRLADLAADVVARRLRFDVY
ncbi:MAG: GAF domain-containing protein [Pseudonocardiaceae bacterium]|nr:GAF domain-containing protein [Pseudonocardiaceae bacterium]